MSISEPSIVIRTDNISKRYVQNEQRPSLRHEALAMGRRLLRQTVQRDVQPQFWALRGVSFTIQRGETVGLIGRNGAGKSTLFRIIAGITTPTMGNIEVNGRCAALIALSAGFNLERTGRENIFLGAALHGIPLQAIRELLPAIIDFAELGLFIDLPIKRYSSGMAARLGFSIAIHILPDVMLIDEILSVGDAAFQKKCMERILQFRAEGRTLIIASHANATIRELCQRTLWLSSGQLIADGNTEDVLARYEGSAYEQTRYSGEGSNP